METQNHPKILSEEEKLRLRKERFNSGENVTTVEAQRVCGYIKYILNFNIFLCRF
jgi:hypothetical protein